MISCKLRINGQQKWLYLIDALGFAEFHYSDTDIMYIVLADDPDNMDNWHIMNNSYIKEFCGIKVEDLDGFEDIKNYYFKHKDSQAAKLLYFMSEGIDVY